MLAATLLIINSAFHIPVGFQSISWLVFLAIAIPLNTPFIRKNFISAPLFAVFKKIMPRLSQTEKEALESGTVWWDGELFSGKPDWNKLSDFPVPNLSREEQDFINGPTKELCKLIDDWKITHDVFDLPPEVWSFIKEKKFLAMIIPKDYGGLGFSTQAHSAVVMKLASRSVSVASTVMVPNSLGPAELLLHYGTQEQKDYYLPRLSSGEEMPCFALTAPEAGSDAASMIDTGIVCKQDFKDKKDVLGIRLNWNKRYTTLAPIATTLGLAFKLFDPDHLLGDKESIGISVALIPTDLPGITIGRRHIPVNMMFLNGPHQGKDVFIPLDYLVGGVSYAGQGWRMLMERLAVGRSVSLPALSASIAQLSCRYSGAYARIRKQFNLPIGRFEGVEESLTRMAGNTYMMEAVRSVTACAVDAGEQPTVLSAIAKYHLTEKMRDVVNDGMDVVAGAGISLGPRNILGRLYQAIPIGITVEGANILTRSMIIFGQGAILSHPYVLKEIHAISDEDKSAALRQFDKAIFSHIGMVISNVIRTLFLGLTGARFSSKPSGSGKAGFYYQHLTRMSAAFALLADTSMLILGGSLKRKEKLSGRLADILSHLYIASCVLKHYQTQNNETADTPLMQWACEQSLYEIQHAIVSFLQNFPVPFVGGVLRSVIFPFGKSFKPPSDKLGQKLAQLLLEPSDARDRLTQGIHIPDNTSETLGKVEDALPKVIAAEALIKAIRKAQKENIINSDQSEEATIEQALAAEIISTEEASVLKQAAITRNDVIQVDDFDFDLK